MIKPTEYISDNLIIVPVDKLLIDDIEKELGTTFEKYTCDDVPDDCYGIFLNDLKGILRVLLDFEQRERRRNDILFSKYM